MSFVKNVISKNRNQQEFFQTHTLTLATGARRNHVFLAILEPEEIQVNARTLLYSKTNQIQKKRKEQTTLKQYFKGTNDDEMSVLLYMLLDPNLTAFLKIGFNVHIS